MAKVILCAVHALPHNLLCLLACSCSRIVETCMPLHRHCHRQVDTAQVHEQWKVNQPLCPADHQPWPEVRSAYHTEPNHLQRSQTCQPCFPSSIMMSEIEPTDIYTYLCSQKSPALRI